MNLMGALSSLAFVLWLLLAKQRLSDRPKLYFKPGGSLAALLDECPALQRVVSPPLWAVPADAHLQLLPFVVSGFLGSGSAPWSQYEDLAMSDGVRLRLAMTSAPSEEAPIVLFLVGACCGVGDLPGQSLVKRLHRAGFRCASYERRGHGRRGLSRSAPRWNLFGDTGDLADVLHALRERYPRSPMVCVGISAGAALLVRALGGPGDRVGRRRALPELAAAVAVAPGYDIHESPRNCRQPYNALMTWRVKDFFIRRNLEALEGTEGVHEALRARNLIELIGSSYAMAGYPSREEYLEDMDPTHRLASITVPTLFLNAASDPLATIELVQTTAQRFMTLEHCAMAITKTGSHCPFYEGLFLGRSWADDATIDFINAALRRYRPQEKPQNQKEPGEAVAAAHAAAPAAPFCVK